MIAWIKFQCFGPNSLYQNKINLSFSRKTVDFEKKLFRIKTIIMLTPKAAFEELAVPRGMEIDSLGFAELMDYLDQLAGVRDQFVIPKLGTIPCGRFKYY